MRYLSPDGDGGGSEAPHSWNNETGELTLRTSDDGNAACAALAYAMGVGSQFPEDAAKIVRFIEGSASATTSDAVRTAIHAIKSRLGAIEAFATHYEALGAA